MYHANCAGVKKMMELVWYHILNGVVTIGGPYHNLLAYIRLCYWRKDGGRRGGESSKR
ncbi:hypothetical protein K469DRAFT_15890 [Zopfia rhizophila CBS 207.26]|uniref:Uncharacterized protein n=1 Tax=Zopfia rhizophila CBS 207.26 TaxID=1314779 RepID=A0A6A6EVS4_9PEZI|nr:hypothetical protein K469DRAFT_15890 [Zopfia rhizophila CBS 207.26]